MSTHLLLLLTPLLNSLFVRRPCQLVLHLAPKRPLLLGVLRLVRTRRRARSRGVARGACTAAVALFDRSFWIELLGDVRVSLQELGLLAALVSFCPP